jgi:hypothetical protein
MYANAFNGSVIATVQELPPPIKVDLNVCILCGCGSDRIAATGDAGVCSFLSLSKLPFRL